MIITQDIKDSLIEVQAKGIERFAKRWLNAEWSGYVSKLLSRSSTFSIVIVYAYNDRTRKRKVVTLIYINQEWAASVDYEGNDEKAAVSALLRRVME